MAIIVGDIHGNVEKVKVFLDYKPEVEHVALGDYLDSFTESVERQLECLQLLMDSNAILVWGNHDLHYLKFPLFQFPGYQQVHAAVYQDILETNINRFKASYVADGWLCTHAGVHRGIADKQGDVKVLADMFNRCWETFLQNRQEGYCYKSIFKFDFMAEGSFAPTNIKQVYGHDDISPPEFVNESCVSLACGNRSFVCLFDTQTEKIVKLSISKKR